MSLHKNLKQLDNAGIYLVSLLSSVLHEKDAPSLPADLNWNLIFQLAKMHSVEAMAFYGAERFIKDDAALYPIWKRCRDANLAQSLLQLEARKEIFTALYEANIRFLPLKGFETKRLYKKLEFRQMSDIDILIDPENTPQIKTLMNGLGYSFQEDSAPYHDEYQKPPCILIEFHKQMLPEDTPKQKYYKNIWKKALPDNEIPGGLKLTPEDYYIYHIAHIWKHYSEFGSGIRSIMDLYVYLDKFREKMNWPYIRQELKTLKLYDFSIKIETLSQHWFASSNKTNYPALEVMQLQRSIFLSGVYGTKVAKRLKQMDSIQVEKGNLQKIKYILKRLFISRQELAPSHPILKRYSVLLPFFWILRLGEAVLYKKSVIKNELELFKEKTKDNENG